MVEYWHWHTLHYGTETYWGGILPHSQRPGRVYREVSDIGALLKALGTTADGFVPDADVTLLYSNDSKWAFEFTPPLHDVAGLPDRAAYQQIFDAFYRGVIDGGAQARIVHASQLGSDAVAFAAEHPVLVAPAFYVATDAQLQFLSDYAIAGGHLIVGIRTAYADDEARARLAVAPPLLADAAGVWYEDYSNLDASITVTGSPEFAVSEDARATRWLDSLIMDGAEQLASYDHVEFGRFPAITTRVSGAGRITYVGTVPNPSLSADLIRWAVPAPVAHAWTRSDTVTIASGVAESGKRLWFVSNWSSSPATATTPVAVTEATGGEAFAAGHDFSLEPWASLVLVDE
jgi:beta-galactosidase